MLAAQAYDQVEGFRHSYVLWEDGTDVMWLVAVFADRESYERNASDPAQHARYLEYRALMEEEPGVARRADRIPMSGPAAPGG
ncbi:MAG: hypothetical protein KatS3mg013_1783 [Actinomycetota bacterium]|nr:MAG: hypothetical protein KatS3mg013_1783 [Actinomycetota bacterium]